MDAARGCAGPRRTRTPRGVDGAATRGARGCSPPWGPRYHRRVPDPGQTRAYLALTLISALWGSYPAFAKLALAHFPPYVLVSLRCTLASAFLAVLLFRRGWEEFRELRAARPAHLRVPRLHRALRLHRRDLSRHRAQHRGQRGHPAGGHAGDGGARGAVLSEGAAAAAPVGGGGRLDGGGAAGHHARELAGDRPSRAAARRLHPDDLAGRLERLHRSTASRCSRCTPPRWPPPPPISWARPCCCRWPWWPRPSSPRPTWPRRPRGRGRALPGLPGRDRPRVVVRGRQGGGRRAAPRSS